MKLNTKKSILFLGLFLMSILSFSQEGNNKDVQKKSEVEKESLEEVEDDIEVESKKIQLFNKYKIEQQNNYPPQSKEVTKVKQENLNVIVEELKEIDPASFEYHWTTYSNSNNEVNYFNHLDTAFKLQPQNVEVFAPFIAHAEITNNVELKNEFCQKLSDTNEYSSAELDYNKNVLFSLDDNSYLITNGNVDTYPGWIQQEVNGLRKNINILNLELLQNTDYRKEIFNQLEIPNNKESMTSRQIVSHILSNKNNGQVYLALTLNHEILREHSKYLWLTGMALKYDQSPNSDYISEITENWENHFSKKNIGTKDQINKNYLLILKKLSIYYKQTNQKEKEKEVNEYMDTICTNFSIANPLK